MLKGFIFFLVLWCLMDLNGQRCASPLIRPINECKTLKEIQFRGELQCQLVFHVFYTKPEERISLMQIESQVEALNQFFHPNGNLNDLSIPQEFRYLNTNPMIQFCLAKEDPIGKPSIGVDWISTTDLGIACKKEFGKRSLMHTNLGGKDLWDPQHYINVYVVNRDQCYALGEAIYPWDATLEEDGIILDYRCVGTIGTVHSNKPYHQGKTLVHEMGHYFGLLHLTADQTDCLGDDKVEDTPLQGKEYFGCPSYPQTSCGYSSQFMNFMSLVDDPCMKLFTKAQVNRMHETIASYRPQIDDLPCSAIENKDLNTVVLRQNNFDWQLYDKEGAHISGFLELVNPDGKLVFQKKLNQIYTMSFSTENLGLNPGLYFLLLSKAGKKITYKIILMR